MATFRQQMAENIEALHNATKRELNKQEQPKPKVSTAKHTPGKAVTKARSTIARLHQVSASRILPKKHYAATAVISYKTTGGNVEHISSVAPQPASEHQNNAPVLQSKSEVEPANSASHLPDAMQVFDIGSTIEPILSVMNTTGSVIHAYGFPRTEINDPEPMTGYFDTLLANAEAGIVTSDFTEEDFAALDIEIAAFFAQEHETEIPLRELPVERPATETALEIQAEANAFAALIAEIMQPVEEGSQHKKSSLLESTPPELIPPICVDVMQHIAELAPEPAETAKAILQRIIKSVDLVSELRQANSIDAREAEKELANQCLELFEYLGVDYTPESIMEFALGILQTREYGTHEAKKDTSSSDLRQRFKDGLSQILGNLTLLLSLN